MKKLLFLILFISSFSFAQVITDSILGKPKFVKEYVVFLNESGPRKFLEFDNEYGHAMIMTPKNLRNSMKKSWFESDFCRYINNETSYDKNRNITKEVWFYKSGEIVDSYSYKFDSLKRLKNYIEENEYRLIRKKYMYNGIENEAHFVEYYKKYKDDAITAFKKTSKWTEDSEKFSVRNIAESAPYFESRYDDKTKTDSVFQITNRINKQIGERTYSSIEDSVFYRRLVKVIIYNNRYQVVYSKKFNYDNDFENKKVSVIQHFGYEYDDKERLVKEIYFDTAYDPSYTMNSYGRLLNYEPPKDPIINSISTYKYELDGKLKEKTSFYKDRISNQNIYQYDGNYIKKLAYLDTWGKEINDLKPSLITFKYKFDKQKNWTECIKNVDGKDLYLWKREIQYY